MSELQINNQQEVSEERPILMDELIQWKDSTIAMLTQKNDFNLGESLALLDELISAHEDGI